MANIDDELAGHFARNGTLEELGDLGEISLSIVLLSIRI